MAEYDSSPPVFYDSGLTYADPAVLPNLKNKMATIKMNFRGLPDLGIIQQCLNIKTALTGNASFTTPTPTLVAFGTLITTAQTKLTAADAAQQAAKLATADKDAAIAALLAGVKQLADYVSMTAAGDGVKIQSAGFSIKAASTPSGVPGMVQNLALTSGDNAGEIDAQWDPIKGVKISYDLQWSPYPATEATWKDLPGTTKSKGVLTGFTSGTQVLIRVRAKGTGGTGAWSQVASKFAP